MVAVAEDVPVEIPEVRRLVLKPNDVIVVQIDRIMRPESLLAIGERLMGVFPGQKVLILERVSLTGNREARPERRAQMTVRATFLGDEYHLVPVLGAGVGGQGVRVDPAQVVEFPGDLEAEIGDAYVLKDSDGDRVALPKVLWALDAPPKPQPVPPKPAAPAASPDGK